MGGGGSEKPVALSALRRAGGALQRLPRPLSWLPAIAWIALIWHLSGQPSGDTPRSLGERYLANLAHAPLFGLLAMWLALWLPREGGWPRLSRAGVLALLVAVLGYALVDELHQSTVAGRHPSATDVVTDLVGAACTLWVVGYVGAREASERGLWRRLAAGVAACAAAALLASVF